MIKNIRTILCASFLLFSFSFSYAQSIQQGTDIFGVGMRLGIYNITVTDKNPPEGATNTSSNGRAGDIIYPFSFDRGLNDRITVGGQFRYNSFILAKDTSATQINEAYGIDLGIHGAFHFVRSEHTDLYVQLLLGYAYLYLADNNFSNQGNVTASGISYSLELGARFYIGNHIGIMLNIAYASYDYPDGTAKGGGYTKNMSLFFTGSTYGIGLCYRL